MKRYTLKRIFRILFLRIATNLPMNGKFRALFVGWGG